MDDSSSKTRTTTHHTDPDTLEFSFYLFLKLHVYHRIDASRATLRRLNRPLAAAVPGPFSARQIHRMIHQLDRRPARQFTDFFDLSPYFVRNRLQGLNHGTALLQTGRGVRNSVQYEWNQRVDESTLESYNRLGGLLDGRMNLGLDVYRLLQAFDLEPFSRQDFLDLFRSHRDHFIKRRWYQISTSTQSDDTRFTRFLLQRLADLRKAGLLDADGDSLRVTDRGDHVAHWFDLFLYSVRYEPALEATSD